MLVLSFVLTGKITTSCVLLPKGIQFGNVMKDIQKLSQCQVETIASGLLKNTALTCIS